MVLMLACKWLGLGCIDNVYSIFVTTNFKLNVKCVPYTMGCAVEQEGVLHATSHTNLCIVTGIHR